MSVHADTPEDSASLTTPAAAERTVSTEVREADRHLRIGWWNTGLAPKIRNTPRTERVDDAAWNVAGAVVLELRRERIDILVLGEMTPEGAERLSAHSEYSIVQAPDLDTSAGITVLFDPATVRVRFDKNVVAALRSVDRKAALEFVVTAPSVVFPFRLLAAHWPSRMLRDNDGVRLALGSNLQSYVDNIAERDGRHGSFHVICGDFNDEPFDPSLTNGLFGTRDRVLARKQKRALYNPFWRFLGERKSLEMPAPHTGPGTCFWSGGATTGWYTFDQFLFTSNFLGDGVWQLVEAEIGVWDRPPLVSDKGTLDSGFDHYPVIVGIRGKRPEIAR